MKYILDFDHTLLDTNAFVDQVYRDNRREILITPEIWKFYKVRDYLYSDVLSWLGSKPIDSIHILTAVTPNLGPQSEEFQKEKLISGNFDELVSSITFMVGEKGQAAAEIASQFPPDESIAFVDDRIEQCLSVKAALPQATCCLMVRGKSEIDDVQEVQGIKIVRKLAEVDDIIESI